MIVETNFETILPIWRQYLWPDREKINPVSHMHYLDMDKSMVPEIYKPIFLAYMIDGKIIGVNSGHSNSVEHYRSRGLYVNPEFRHRGIATKLLLRTIDQARIEGRHGCWSLPRKESIGAYLGAGFEISSDYFKTETSDNNCYVIKKL